LTKAIALLGTGSDVGKSILTTALCRILSDAGYNTAPFKAQNMSNNAGVTPAGLEIGRAQLVQAEAARQVPHVDMNPVLIKPTTDTGAQVILNGKVLGNTDAASWFRDTSMARKEAYAALKRLMERHEVVVLEGAGSCAEVNLRSRDYVNFDAAKAADAPVLLVADIDRGGVFGQVVGTLECLEEEDRRQVAGILINRFRGDLRLFEDGVRYLEKKTGLPVLGVIPYLYGLDIESEDGLPLETKVDPPEAPCKALARIGIIRLPHIANFTDFLAFDGDPVEIHYLYRPRDLKSYDLLILPGTKNTRFDLEWLHTTGWTERLKQAKKPMLGICGGYQILGQEVLDPTGVEGNAGASQGLGLLPVRTVLEQSKVLKATTGVCMGEPVHGYEIHMGQTKSLEQVEPALYLSDGSSDGVISNKVLGCYLHGLLDAPRARAAILSWACPGQDFSEVAARSDAIVRREAAYKKLAQHVAASLDLARLSQILGLTISGC
jgi:adenosylcobyric acid synthase